MIERLLCLALLFSPVARAANGPDINQVRSSEELAKFVSTMVAKATLNELLAVLDSPVSIRLASSTNAIPVREVYGTIVEERYRDALGERFYDRGKKYEVREICSFQDAGGQVERFHICIYEARQYRIMRDFLKRQAAKNHKAQANSKATPDMSRT